MNNKWDTTILAALLFLLSFVLVVAFDTPTNRAHGVRCFDAIKSAPKDSIRARYDVFCVLPKGAEP